MTEPLPEESPQGISRLVDVVDLEAIGDDRYGVDNPDRGYGHRVFGGQVAAQALRAGQLTVDPDRAVHSLHGYFLLGGRPGVPIEYAVERIRDGRSFTTRRVVGWQGDDAIFSLSASFHRTEDGIDYQLPRASDVPLPDEAGDDLGFIPAEARASLPFELRELGPTDPDESGWHASTRRAWMRVKEPIPDDPALHACLFAFMSDMGAVMAAMAPVSTPSWQNLMGASLDHAMWFHRPIRVDEWFLYDQHAVSNAGARGLCRGTIHAVDGTLGVSMTQEALLRQLSSRSDPAVPGP